MTAFRIQCRSAVLALVLAIAPLPLLAQTYPSRAVRIVTPFSAGSAPDTALRAVAQQLSSKWAQPVIVDNRPGGNGFVATAASRQAKPDGYELIHLDSNHLTTHPHTFRNLPYSPTRDYEPIRVLLRSSFFVAVAADSPIQNLSGLLDAARAKPEQLSYGSWFTGSPGHLGALKLSEMAKVSMLHVPYKDQPLMYSALSKSEVDWAFGSAGSAGPLEKAGKLRFLAYSGAQRLAIYPDVPTISEALPQTRGYSMDAWIGLLAPKGTPVAILNKINADLAQALASPEVVERYRVMGFEAPDVGLQKMSALMREETDRWATVLAKSPVRLD